MENIPLPKSLPSEILHEVFVQLHRNEIEKIQLVSKSWSEHIRKSTGTLPLRLLQTIQMSTDEDRTSKILILNRGCVGHEGKYEVDLKDRCRRNATIIRSLNSCVFMNMCVNADTVDEENGHFNILRMLTYISRRKIQVINPLKIGS